MLNTVSRSKPLESIEAVFPSKQSQFHYRSPHYGTKPQSELPKAVIRTSDRNFYRSCRRKWALQSHLRFNLGPKQNASPLWMGSGFHFVMEDYLGLQRFADPIDAWKEYVRASIKFHTKDNLPNDYEDLSEMTISMLEYFKKWREFRKEDLYETYVVDGVPQVEVNFRVDIPLSKEFLEKHGYRSAEYSGTIDAVWHDPVGDVLWLVDFKTAKIFSTNHYLTDPQITAYCWAASHMYDKPVVGMIYAQHLKRNIEPLKPLKNGHISVNKNMATTYIQYREALIENYGSLSNSPQINIDFLSSLFKKENDLQDAFIRYDKIYRGQDYLSAENDKIIMEAEEMISVDTNIFPNPSRDCVSFCSFTDPCVGMDDGSDYLHLLKENYQVRPSSYDEWRQYIRWPDEQDLVAIAAAEDAKRETKDYMSNMDDI